jgi:hypothetical protein
VRQLVFKAGEIYLTYLDAKFIGLEDPRQEFASALCWNLLFLGKSSVENILFELLQT